MLQLLSDICSLCCKTLFAHFSGINCAQLAGLYISHGIKLSSVNDVACHTALHFLFANMQLGIIAYSQMWPYTKFVNISNIKNINIVFFLPTNFWQKVLRLVYEKEPFRSYQKCQMPRNSRVFLTYFFLFTCSRSLIATNALNFITLSDLLSHLPSKHFFYHTFLPNTFFLTYFSLVADPLSPRMPWILSHSVISYHTFLPNTFFITPSFQTLSF